MAGVVEAVDRNAGCLIDAVADVAVLAISLQSVFRGKNRGQFYSRRVRQNVNDPPAVLRNARLRRNYADAFPFERSEVFGDQNIQPGFHPRLRGPHGYETDKRDG